jgi:bisphosphoglycerate-independent phosphoglycerate mutase
MAAGAGAKDVKVHAFLDGRDTPPRSAEASLLALERLTAELKAGRIASICGRYYAMDRDSRWERVQPAYDLITQGKSAQRAGSAVEGLRAAYARGESDEFVKATVIGAPARMEDGDAAIFMNFRADRARQMTRALTDPGFKGFTRERIRGWNTSARSRATARTSLMFRPRFRRRASPTGSARSSQRRGSSSCASPRPRNTRTSPISSTAGWRRPIRARSASSFPRRGSRPMT